MPQYFEEAAKSFTEDTIAETILCSPDPEKHIKKIREVTKAGADHVYLIPLSADGGRLPETRVIEALAPSPS